MQREHQHRIQRTCPACGGDDLIPILYGRPAGPEAFAAAARGEVELGGHLTAPEPEGQRCRSCGAGV